MWAYPGFCGDRTNFTPSLLLSIDEPYLNSLFIDYCLTSYVNEESSTTKYKWSPIYTPMKILKKFPPVRMGIAGVDPIRDSSIVVFRKTVKAGVDIKGKLYKNLFHGYLEMASYPFHMEDWNEAFEDLFDFVRELTQI